MYQFTNIYIFVALFVLLLCPFDISAGIGAFVIGLGQISSFLSGKRKYKCVRYIYPDLCVHG